MNAEIHFIVKDSLDGGFEAQSITESIYTQAETYALLKHAVRDAIVCHFDEETTPRVVHLHYVRDEVIAV